MCQNIEIFCRFIDRYIYNDIYIDLYSSLSLSISVYIVFVEALPALYDSFAWHDFVWVAHNLVSMLSRWYDICQLTVTIAWTGLAAFARQWDGIIAFSRRTFVLDIATLNACNNATLLGYLKCEDRKIRDYKWCVETLEKHL